MKVANNLDVGKVVVYCNPSFGSYSDKRTCKAYLEVGKEYKIDSIESNLYGTILYLEGFGTMTFNCAMFEFKEGNVLNLTQERTIKVLENIIKMVQSDKDDANMFSCQLELMLESLQERDAFGTEGQCDPQRRSKRWKLLYV